MSFMSSYKRLDRLCREIYPDARNGVSGYIGDMEQKPGNAFRVPGWDGDLKALKHYRWVRNQIAHDENADEESLCEPGDALWLDDFYQRIMDRTDPLALAYQASKPKKPEAPAQQPSQPAVYRSAQSAPAGCSTMLIGMLVAVAAIAALLFL